MLSLEEPAERLAARLIAAGADLDGVEILGHVEDHDDDGRPYQRPWQLPGDCGALEATLRELGLAVVTIDGLGYSVRGDSHNYANVGSALSALAGTAERTGCAILGLTHPPKGNSDAVTAAIGSTAWTALSRITWVMGVDPTDETGSRRVVRPAPGSNYRLPDRGLSFTIANHDETEAGYVTGLHASDVDPQTITAPPLADSDEERSALDEARAFVRDYLGMGAQRATDVKAAARKAGIASDRTLARARQAEGVETRRDGFGPGTVYWWSLPCVPSQPHSCQPPDAGNHDNHVASMTTTAAGEE
jgi:putative DNA primase/helicase